MVIGASGFKRMNVKLALNKNSEPRHWIVSLLLIQPVLLLYFAHFFLFNNNINIVPTGFIHPDMPYYMANAREHFDNGSFQITYGNPSSPYYETPAIYFQPMSVFLGILLSSLKSDPGLLFMVFGFLSALICSRVGLAFYQEVIADRSWQSRLGLIVFFYGGGLLVIAGLLFSIIKGAGTNGIFHFDPFDGWWFLNFGRNLIFPTEAFYHSLFLGNILLLIRKKFAASLLVSFILTISHPFTGIENIVILLAWSFLEKYFLQNNNIPKYFFPCCVVIAAYHFIYYFLFLNLFQEHRQLVSQWSLAWELKASNILLAYCLVGGLALWRIRNMDSAIEFFSDIRNRLFTVWFIVVFILANHEFFIDPVQPIHFARGYIWISLFMMGRKTLFDLFNFFKKKLNKTIQISILTVLFCVFISDNVTWVVTQVMNNYSDHSKLGIYMTHYQREILTWINKNYKNHVVLSQDLALSYYIPCYTSLRTWHSHVYNTPYVSMRKQQLIELFRYGKFYEYWQSINLLIIFQDKLAQKVLKKEPDWLVNNNGVLVYKNSRYVIYRISPQGIMQ